MPSALNLTRSSPTRFLNGTMFDRVLKATHRGRVVDPNECSLHKLMGGQMLDRRGFVRHDTPIVLEVGAGSSWYLRHMVEKEQYHGLKQYIQCDISEEALHKAYEELRPRLPKDIEYVQIVADEEKAMPFGIPERSVDLAVSCLSAHWVNDLETCMVNLRKVLRRDAFLMATIFGGNTLYELRSCFTVAEQEVDGGRSAHVSPMLDGTGISSLMLQCGFNLPSIDMDRYVIKYDTPFHLFEHLQAMGESSCLHMRRDYTSLELFAAVAALYDHMYNDREEGVEAAPDTPSRVQATFEIFNVMAWAPSSDQPQPLERGSADLSLKSIGTPEMKEFQKVLEEIMQNPNDASLQAKAEQLYKKLKVSNDRKVAEDRRTLIRGDLPGTRTGLPSYLIDDDEPSHVAKPPASSDAPVLSRRPVTPSKPSE